MSSEHKNTQALSKQWGASESRQLSSERHSTHCGSNPVNAWSGQKTVIEAATPVAKPVGTEFSGPFPAWQVQFGDPDATRLYIDASNGALLAARSDTWRFFDFIWGLHIMDWNERHRINSWWLLLFGIGGTIISVSGFVLLANRFPKIRRPRAKRS